MGRAARLLWPCLGFICPLLAAQPTPPATSICDLPEYRGTAAYNHYCRSLDSAPAPRTQAKPDPFPQDARDYASLVSRLAPVLPHPAAIEEEYGSDPTSADDLAERLQRLLGVAYETLYDLQAQVSEANFEVAFARQTADDLRQSRSALAAVERENKTLQSHERFFAKATQTVLAELDDQQDNALRWFLYVTPKGGRRYLGSFGDVRQSRLPLTPIPAIPSESAEPRRRAAKLHFSGADVSHYTNAEKISSIATYCDSIPAAARELATVRRLNERDGITRREEQLKLVEGGLKRSRATGQHLLEQLRIAHENFVVVAVESYVWKIYVTHVSIAEARKFYDLNKHWYQLAGASWITDDEVKRALVRGEAGLDILASEAEGMQEFFAVERRTLDLMADVKRFLAEAPEIAAMGTPEETKAFVDEVDKKRDDFSIALAQSRANALGLSSSMAQALRNVRLPPSLGGIAKRLGLGEDAHERQ